MSENLMQLESLLGEELRIFSNVLRLEKEKSEAIIKKDGNLMQKLSLEQENYLDKIPPLEKNRRDILNYYSRKNPKGNLTLTDIASIESATDDLTQIGSLLKKTLDKIKSVQETNNKMMNDNLEYFRKIMKEIRQSVSIETGYSEKGIEKGKTLNSFILDKKI